MISKETISLVRDRTDIIAVVSESVPTLKKRGRRFLGLCPFHKEKTPSFNVNPDTGLYHCFGCKESGDVIRFLERVEGYAFAEAVRALAERAGIVIEEERGALPSEAERHKKERAALYAAMQMAATWYEQQLLEHPLASFAVDELARRELAPDNEAVRAFRVGYAPSAWDGLATFLKKQGVSPAIGESVGLLVPRSSGTGYYDRFRHRLMFAVIDAQGRVVAFSGRALADPPDDSTGLGPRQDGPRDPPPKYINSPESPIYVKGANLFGLWQARHSIRQQEKAVLVEGNFDVVSLHARGVTNVIAPLGTAFTIDQARLLRRYTVSLTLLFDGDNAGRKAVTAALEPSEQAELDAEVAMLPNGTDPDEFVRNGGGARASAASGAAASPSGAEALKHVMAQARGLREYLIDVLLDASFNPGNSRELMVRVDGVCALIAGEKDPFRRAMLKARADDALGRLDLVRFARDAIAPVQRRFAVASQTGRANVGPRPYEARVTPRPPGQEERKAIVGAILEFPGLLDDSSVLREIELLEGDSARIVAAIVACSRVTASGEKRLDGTEFLAQMSPAIQAFASARLAAPTHETLEEARATVAANSKKLRGTTVAQETREAVREQHRVAGDWEAGLETLKRQEALAREGKGLGRR
ncbi:MAG TPA: DNA primase [Polyangiaceae bacterium]|jgi:DNA primase|nr:DNA primase [Polyangiaceae bacterium]